MRNIFNISLILTLSLNLGYAQSIKRSVINSFGSSSSNGTIYLSETFGQPSNISTVSDGNNFIRQGFEQPVSNLISIPGCTDPLAFNYDVNANTDDGSCNYCSNDTSFTEVTACESYQWNGQTYTESGTYEYSEQNDNNYSMSFDGVDDLIEIPSSLTFNLQSRIFFF